MTGVIICRNQLYSQQFCTDVSTYVCLSRRSITRAAKLPAAAD